MARGTAEAADRALKEGGIGAPRPPSGLKSAEKAWNNMEKIKLETRNISIEFPGVKALDQVNFEVETGEIRALVGANGAGKSTLMKILAGANPDYTGEILLGGRKVEIRTPVEAKRLGIQIVYQEVDTALYPTLSVAENIIQNDMVMGLRDRKSVV